MSARVANPTGHVLTATDAFAASVAGAPGWEVLEELGEHQAPAYGHPYPAPLSIQGRRDDYALSAEPTSIPEPYLVDPKPVVEPDPDAEAPANNASRRDWEAYAVSQGYGRKTLVRLSRSDLQQLFGA